MGKKIKVGSTTTSITRARARGALDALYRGEEPVEAVATRFAALGRPAAVLLEEVLLRDDVLDAEHDDRALASAIRGRAATVLQLVAGLDAFDALVDAVDFALDEEDYDVATAAIFALRDLGPDVAPLLLAELVALDDDDDDEPSDRALEGALCEALSECGARSDDVYARLLRHFDRQPALGSLHLASYGDARAVAPIRERFDARAVVAAGADPDVDLELSELGDALDTLGAAWDDAARARLEAARATDVKTRGAGDDDDDAGGMAPEGDGTT